MSKARAIFTLAALLGALDGASCAGRAVVLRRDEWSGDLALRGPLVPAVEQAQLSMAAHCGGRVRAQFEGASGANEIHYVCITRGPATPDAPLAAIARGPR